MSTLTDERSTQTRPVAWMNPSTGAILHEKSRDMCDNRRRFWTPLGPIARPESWAQLMSFYAVDTPEKMVEAMERHIEKLQSKVPPSRDQFPRTPREG